jgi:hypothetical protein
MWSVFGWVAATFNAYRKINDNRIEFLMELLEYPKNKSGLNAVPPFILIVTFMGKF